MLINRVVSSRQIGRHWCRGTYTNWTVRMGASVKSEMHSTLISCCFCSPPSTTASTSFICTFSCASMPLRIVNVLSYSSRRFGLEVTDEVTQHPAEWVLRPFEGILSRHVTSHSGQLSLLSSTAWEISIKHWPVGSGCILWLEVMACSSHAPPTLALVWQSEYGFVYRRRVASLCHHTALK